MKTILNVNLYTVQEAAEILHVTERTVRAYLKSGKLRGQKIGKDWHISEPNILAFVHGE